MGSTGTERVIDWFYWDRKGRCTGSTETEEVIDWFYPDREGG